jgi:hypothetical protein
MGNAASKALNEKRRKIELEHEARKRDIELRAEELKFNYGLEIRKAEMEHQHKITELITQMKQAKLHAGKELIISYMDTMNLIIQQNGSTFQAAVPLLQQLSNNKLSDSMREATENIVKKIYDVIFCFTLFFFCFLNYFSMLTTYCFRVICPLNGF